jgi:hypothetical protein
LQRLAFRKSASLLIVEADAAVAEAIPAATRRRAANFISELPFVCIAKPKLPPSSAALK